MAELIPLSKPLIGDEEKQAVMAVLDSGIVAQGPVVKEFENSFADYCGTQHAVALNSGTAALHVALHSVGVESGDSVITTPFTFAATVNTILMQGAKPKFVDIEPDSFNIDASQLDDAYDDTVKAILPVDLYGQPADYKEIGSFANKHNLKIIEDACQAIGAKYSGKVAGALGTVGCFSLYATKNIMSAEGGVLTTDDDEVANQARSFRQHGMDVNGNYDYVQLGYNYRTTDILAAIALAQLVKADSMNQQRVNNANKLNAGLEVITGLVTPTIKPERTSVFHQYTVRITEDFVVSRQEFMDRLKQKGILSAVYYPKALHLYPHLNALGYSEGDFPVAEQAAKEVVSLPVNPALTEEQINYIIESVHEVANA